MNEDTVTISRARYESLVRDSDFLACLEDCGVDNWDGYGYAREALAEMEEGE